MVSSHSGTVFRKRERGAQQRCTAAQTQVAPDAHEALAFLRAARRETRCRQGPRLHSPRRSWRSCCFFSAVGARVRRRQGHPLTAPAARPRHGLLGRGAHPCPVCPPPCAVVRISLGVPARGCLRCLRSAAIPAAALALPTITGRCSRGRQRLGGNPRRRPRPRNWTAMIGLALGGCAGSWQCWARPYSSQAPHAAAAVERIHRGAAHRRSR
jgi:hypothetical protein